jgi:hypothetical protein
MMSLAFHPNIKNTVNFGGKKEMKPLIIWNMFKKNLK